MLVFNFFSYKINNKFGKNDSSTKIIYKIEIKIGLFTKC